MSGYTEEQLRNKTEIETMEFILENISSMNSFQQFTFMKELILIKCRIDRIEGLKGMPHLKKLWLSENKISKLEGFDNCGNLEKLVLYNNCISKIENLEPLTNLRELDLSQNNIVTIENLQPLQKLEILNLALNEIEHVGERLKCLSSILQLNLSGNRISNVEEVKGLRELKNLKVLYFFDPHFGENPICKIFNYQTYMLFHFDFLDKFDNLNLNEESKKCAVVEFKKKRIYYNMKIKCLKRLFITIEKLLKANLVEKASRIVADIKVLTQFESLEGEKYSEISAQAKTDKKERLESLHKAGKVYEEVRKYFSSELSKHIHFITIELESTGNFKLEEGTPAEKWYQSCINLVNSRFDSSDLEKYGVKGINVNRVMRIYNRFLRNRFEEKAEDYLDLSKPGYKKNFEYLFIGVDPDHPKEIFHIVEKGYRSKKECEQFGIPSVPILFNTVYGAALPKLLQSRQNSWEIPTSSKSGAVNLISPSYLLFCKVIMLKPELDSAHPSFEPSKRIGEIFKDSSLNSTSPDTLVTYREYKASSKLEHKLFFIHDHTLILPEYLIEFSYEIKNSNHQTAFIGDTLVSLQNPSLNFIQPGEDKQPDNTVDQKFTTKINEVKKHFANSKFRSRLV